MIRPDPENMRLAYQADEWLQERVAKHRIKFLHVLHPKVREAIKKRGECWRITPLPTTREQMQAMIAASRVCIGGREIYYYNAASGTRFLTYQEFADLGSLDPPALAEHLTEIRNHAGQPNALGYPEVAFFMADNSFSKADFAAYDFLHLSRESLTEAYERLRAGFQSAVPAPFRRDDLTDAEWRSRMYAALIGETDQASSEVKLLGLGSEFFMAVQWLPGGRIKNGKLYLDSIFQTAAQTDDPELRSQCDEAVRHLIDHFLNDYDDLQYINIARVIDRLSVSEGRRKNSGRRAVYIAEIKPLDRPSAIVSHIRMQKFGVAERLNDPKDPKPLDVAIYQSEEYTEYILDRWLGCRQLGMNLPPRLSCGRIVEPVSLKNGASVPVRSPYFVRDYVFGVATDKLPGHRFENEEFALHFARLLGRAAAVNMIVGRCDEDGGVLFDDGDEMALEDDHGLPVEIVVADHTGSFRDYQGELAQYAKDYAAPMTRRLEHVACPDEFCEAYLASFVQKFAEVQQEFRNHRQVYEQRFAHKPRDVQGSFAYRWECVLARMDRADPQELAGLIREHLAVAGEVTPTASK